MGVKSSKQSYNVEQVGHGIKAKSILRKTDSQEPQVPVANDTIIEEIISAAHIDEPTPRLSKEEQKKEEDLIIAKVRGELVSNSEENAIVKEDNSLTNGTTNDLDAITVVKEEVSRISPIVTVQSIVAAEQARVAEEKPEEKISEELLKNFESNKIDEISSIPCTNEVNLLENQTQSDVIVEEGKTEKHVIPNETPTSNIELNETQVIGTVNGEEEKDNVEKEQVELSTEQNEVSNEVTYCKLEVPTCNKVEKVVQSESEEKFNASAEPYYNQQSIEKQSNTSEESCSTLRIHEDTSKVSETENHQVAELPNSIEESPTEKEEESVLTPKETYLKQISDTEKIVNGLKERILHFTGTAEDKEFSVLHEELIKHIIQLDDINFEEEEVKNERRRVIKMIQQSVQNLEKKIKSSDGDDQHPSDSE